MEEARCVPDDRHDRGRWRSQDVPVWKISSGIPRCCQSVRPAQAMTGRTLGADRVAVDDGYIELADQFNRFVEICLRRAT